MEGQQSDIPRTVSFAAGLAPLQLAQESSSKGIFRTSALIAATPHSPTNQKRNTDGSAGSSILVLKPRWRLGGSSDDRTATLLAAMTTAQNHGSFPGALTNVKNHPCEPPASAGSSKGRQGYCEGSVPPPSILRFETWRHEGGKRVRLTLAFHVATSELVVRSDDGLEVTVMVYGPSGLPLEAWDLHVGATLKVLGRQLTLRKADPGTIKWLDGEAYLLRTHKRRLEDELSAFAPIVREGGMLSVAAPRGAGCLGAAAAGGGGSAGCGGSAGMGGGASLRRLREEVALLAGRLRQHKAKVPLPPDLQPLVGEGPTSWRMDDPESLLQLSKPFQPPSPHHSRGGRALARGFALVSASSRTPVAIEVGTTPTWVGQLSQWKHEQRLIQLSGLAESAVAAGLAQGGRGAGGSGTGAGGS